MGIAATPTASANADVSRPISAPLNPKRSCRSGAQTAITVTPTVCRATKAMSTAAMPSAAAALQLQLPRLRHRHCRVLHRRLEQPSGRHVADAGLQVFASGARCGRAVRHAGPSPRAVFSHPGTHQPV